jgi:cell division topological specificity factor
MGLFDLFRSKKEPQTASVAKERLQIVLAHERASREAPEFLPILQQELLDVVRKYVEVEDDVIKVSLGRQGDTSVLEINIELDKARMKPRPVPLPSAASATAKPLGGGARVHTGGKRRR